MYTENYETLLREIKEIYKWRNSSFHGSKELEKLINKGKQVKQCSKD
jgi:hypothetical protein